MHLRFTADPPLPHVVELLYIGLLGTSYFVSLKI